MSGIAHAAAEERAAGPYRVMVVDDSAIVRGLIARALEADEQVKVVASVGDGSMALGALDRHDVEVVVLDIDMPVMDGLTALPRMLEKDPELRVVIASTLTRKNAEISLRALEMGASDCLSKPTSEPESAQTFNVHLVERVKALGKARRGGVEAAPGADVENLRPEIDGRSAVTHRLFPRAGPVVLRTDALVTEPEVIAIGSSTGGPQALFNVLGHLDPGFDQPILITQHMPATFTTILAEHIAKVSGRPCAEGVDGELVRPGRIYVAPGDHHMVVEGAADRRRIRLLKTPPENFCRPAVDVMLRSLVDTVGGRLLVIVLTGMGQDGLRGAERVVQAGGSVIAQDESSSVVWGMPGAVATRGLCVQVLPVDQIGPFLNANLRGPAA